MMNEEEPRRVVPFFTTANLESFPPQKEYRQLIVPLLEIAEQTGKELEYGVQSELTEDTFQTLATPDSFGPTGSRRKSTHPPVG